MAKPENWDSMSDKMKDRSAQVLFKSGRGRWLIGKALHEAVEVMRKEDKPALSDIGDLEILAERLFPYTPAPPIPMP